MVEPHPLMGSIGRRFDGGVRRHGRAPEETGWDSHPRSPHGRGITVATSTLGARRSAHLAPVGGSRGAALNPPLWLHMVQRREVHTGMPKGMWSVTNTRQVFRDRWIGVRADDCVTSSGVTIAPYYLVETNDFVHMLAFDMSDRAVLVRQYRHGYAGLTLELPGGIMDERETDIPGAAARELREETGFTGGRLTHLISLSPDPGRYTNRVHLVLAEGVIAGPAAPEPTEDIETVLVPRRELPSLACSGAVTNAGHVGLILLALAHGTDA
jgi:8-oxo-dGTP pyrophosphatase MutT (NUDIX family)